MYRYRCRQNTFDFQRIAIGLNIFSKPHDKKCIFYMSSILTVLTVILLKQFILYIFKSSDIIF